MGHRRSIVLHVIPHWADLFDIDHCPAPSAFPEDGKLWDPLSRVSDLIRATVADRPGYYTEVAREVWIGSGTTIAATASISGPAVFGSGCVIRHSAFVRGRVLAGDDCVIGNSTELKNCILFDEVQVPHFNYVGDSILGYRTHLGAGVILSNVRLDHGTVVIRAGEVRIDSGLPKLGALIGDDVEVGCNTVCNPGTIIGRGAVIYPLSIVGGVVERGAIVKRAEFKKGSERPLR
jgi:NDP-sugar pyrophosphorylase family protein